MDKLSDLPPKNDTVKTPEETAVMDQFFPGGGVAASNAPPSHQPDAGEPPQPQQLYKSTDPSSSRLNWKLIGFSAVLFISLANPWIDKLLCNIPYCGGNTMTLLGIKVLLFLLLIVVFSLFT